MIPTPSQPMKNWNMLLAVTRIIMVTRKINRYLKNFVICGSVAMYQWVNSKIDHVTYRAIGINIIEYWSNLKLMLMLNVDVLDQLKLVTIDSVFE